MQLQNYVYTQKWIAVLKIVTFLFKSIYKVKTTEYDVPVNKASTNLTANSGIILVLTQALSYKVMILYLNK